MTETGPCLVEVNSRCHGAAGSWMPLARALTGYTQAALGIYIYVFVFCLCMLMWQCCRSCSCVQVDACVDAFLDGHAFAGRIHAKLGQSVQGFIFNPTWMSQELSKWLVNGL